MNILVTGGAGFIGSNFIKYILAKYDYTIVNLDLLTYTGNLENLEDVSHKTNYHFVHGDIRDQELISEIFHDYDIQAIINFAAESLVDRSIEDPTLFFETNVLGTEVLLEEAKKHWKLNPMNMHCKQFKENVKFIQISTDEVYGPLDNEGYHTEKTNLAPNSPYSASKASADMIVRAYHATYGVPVMITRCSNNYGPYQFSEKLIPLIIDRALKDEPIPVNGDGRQVRDWLFVEDHCRAIDTVLHKGRIGEIYNIGGNNEKENIDIVNLTLERLDKSESQIEYVADRLGHDGRYAINNTKINKELGWIPIFTFEQGIDKTIQWYLSSNEWMQATMHGDKVT